MDRKMGNDMSTQIRENDKDLFDFNYEVQPILEVVCHLCRHSWVKSLKLAKWNFSKKNT